MLSADDAEIAELKKSLERLQYLQKGSSTGVAIHDNGVIMDANPALSELTGYTYEELKGMNGLLLIAPEWRNYVMDHIRSGYTDVYDTEGLAKDGTIYPIEIKGKNIRFEGRDVRVTEFRDISDRKRFEEQLQRSRQELDSIIRTTPDIIYRLDKEGRITFISEAVRKYGFSPKELSGKPITIFLHPEDQKRVENRLQQKTPAASHGKQMDVRLVFNREFAADKDMSLVSENEIRFFNVKLNGIYKPGRDGNNIFVGTQGLARDITEKRRTHEERMALEEQLQRARKMEAVGTLAGGVAHDLNNLLSGIVSYPDLLLTQLPVDSPLRKPLTTILKTGKKAAAIVEDLLTLARRNVAISKIVNLNPIVTEYIESPQFQKILDQNPKLIPVLNLEPDLLNLEGSPIHLSKTLMNLVMNAAEAMTSGGFLSISTKNRYIDRPVQSYEHIEEGEYVILEVADQGVGISPEDLERIFEPFYTKKTMGISGTGLGMAVVWGTIKDHGGYIDIDSRPGRGTVFHLYFPATRNLIPDCAENAAADDCDGRGETLLVVDDVQEQREIVSAILENLGYRVSSAESGEAALEHVRHHQVDLVILDMIMEPGMDGLETFKSMRLLRSDQKAIITSGFSETDRVEKARALGACQYIKKPFTLEKIARAVRTELDRESVEASGEKAFPE